MGIVNGACVQEDFTAECIKNRSHTATDDGGHGRHTLVAGRHAIMWSGLGACWSSERITLSCGVIAAQFHCIPFVGAETTPGSQQRM